MVFKERPERIGIDHAAELRDSGGYTVEVRLRNLSTLGFMADIPDPVLIGSYVSLDVAGVGAVEAQVRWQLGGQMGGQFLDPISLTKCEWTATRIDSDQAA